VRLKFECTFSGRHAGPQLRAVAVYVFTVCPKDFRAEVQVGLVRVPSNAGYI
jgi:hypothetical protein